MIMTFLSFSFLSFSFLSFFSLVTELLIGENRGMGAVKNILAKDFLGNWMILYTATVDGTIQVNKIIDEKIKSFNIL